MARAERGLSVGSRVRVAVDGWAGRREYGGKIVRLTRATAWVEFAEQARLPARTVSKGETAPVPITACRLITGE